MSGKYDLDRDLHILGIERQLAELKEHEASGRALIDFLRKQLAEKEAEIERFRRAIQNSLDTGMDRYIREVAK